MICKAPNDNYKYTVEWAAELGADTILTSTWVVETGIVKDGDSTNNITQTTIDLSGGTAGTTYTLTNQIATAGGDVYEKDLYIKVQIQVLG